MDILLAGNIGYVTESFLSSTFPDDHIIFDGECDVNPAVNRKNLMYLNRIHDIRKQDVLDDCELDYIIFFSYNLTCHSQQAGEMENLRRLLRYCRERNTRFLYLAGPEAAFSQETGKTVIASFAEQLCVHYARVSSTELKILRVPYLYSAVKKEDYLYRIFRRADEEHVIVFSDASSQGAYFLSLDDLGELLYRILDNWDSCNEILNVPDVFAITFSQLGKELQKYFPGAAVTFDEQAVVQCAAPNDKVLRSRYGWFPKLSILEDLPWLYAEYSRVNTRRRSRLESLKALMNRGKTLAKVLETAALFLLTLFLSSFTEAHAQFQFLDLRLIYVVVIGTVHGMNMGILAAALSSAALIRDEAARGINWQTLFYEPTNWLPFIFYFLVGAICGYVQLKNRNDIAFVQNENSLLQEKFYFMRALYQDAAHEKRVLKKQILGSRDSFGKIFDITRKLDVVQPQEVFIRTIHVMEEVLQNHTIMLYSFGKNQHFARLEASSREIAQTAAKSLRVDDYRIAMGEIGAGNMWVNTDLIPGLPMYMIGIRKEGRMVLLLVIQTAEYEQMTLYYQNLVKILCGLTETALLRAINYQNALHEEQYEGNTIFMKESYFLQKLNLYHSMQEEKLSNYTLVRLDRREMTLEEADLVLQSHVRESDTAGLSREGELYLILHQTASDQAQVVVDRLERAGFSCVVIPKPEENRL